MKENMMKTGIVASICIASLCAAFPVSAAKRAPRALAPVPEARIAEIAESLPEKPCADGAPASDRSKWEPLAETKEGKAIVSAAERLLAEPVPEVPDDLYLEFSRNGNRRNYEKRFFTRINCFERLFTAECLENKGRFIGKIAEYSDVICAMRSWTLPAHDGELTCFNGSPHVDLVSAAISLNLAYCLAWLGDALPAAMRGKVYSEIERRTFRPHLAHARGKTVLRRHWWFHGGNNWNSVCNCCVVRAALAIVPDRRLRAEFVAHAEGSVPFALAGYTNDGYCSEGMGYWNYGYGHHLMMGLSVRAATDGKVDMFAAPKTRTVMKYAYGYQLQAGRSPRFADGGGNPSTSLLALGRQVWPELAYTPALSLPLLASGYAQFSLRAFGQELPPCEPTMDVLPVRTWFDDAQVLISRFAQPGDRGMRWSLAFKGGHNAELHNHNDVGTYTVMMDGCEMAGDPGGEVYTRRTFSKDRYQSKMLNSYGHPVPVVGGQLQRGGRAAAAKVVDTRFTDNEDSVTIDYAAAYKVPSLRSLRRTVVFNRERCTFTVTDKAEFSSPTTFEVPVITYREWTKDEKKMFFTFKKTDGVRRMKLAVSASAPLVFTSEKIENPGRIPPERMSFAFERPVSGAEITMTFSAGR
jgi:hypothetical protein